MTVLFETTARKIDLAMRAALKGSPKISAADMKTEAERAALKVQYAIWSIEDFRKSLKRSLESHAEFATKVANEPGYLFSWDSNIENLGTTRVLQEVLGCEPELQTADPIQWLKNVREYATKEVLRRAKYGSRSTSQTSNLYEAALTQAWAKVAEGGMF